MKMFFVGFCSAVFLIIYLAGVAITLNEWHLHGGRLAVSDVFFALIWPLIKVLP